MLKRFLHGSQLKATVQRAARIVGLEIRASGPAVRDDLRLAAFLKAQEIDLVLDVGANRGQFAEALFGAGYLGEIVSFEALPAAHSILEKKAAQHPRWHSAPARALSDRAGVTEFRVNSADATSSLFYASDSARATIPGLQPTSVVPVQTARLDDFLERYRVAERRTFLKVDVQGGEGLVLAGAHRTLRAIVGLVVELSFTELYSGQPLAMDILPDLSACGFEIFDIAVAYRDPGDFRLHQADVVLFHPQRCLSASAVALERSGSE